MQGPHPNWYLQPERLPTLASAKQPHNYYVFQACGGVTAWQAGRHPTQPWPCLHSTSSPLTELATSQGYGQSGSAVLPTSGGNIKCQIIIFTVRCCLLSILIQPRDIKSLNLSLFAAACSTMHSGTDGVSVLPCPTRERLIYVYPNDYLSSSSLTVLYSCVFYGLKITAYSA
jgi:hypothetical protein